MKRIDFSTREVSSSALKEAKKSTRDFLWYYAKPKKDASHFSFGNAMELYLIDKEEFKEKVVVFDESERPVPGKNYKTTENQVWKAKFYEDNAGKYIIAATGDESFEQIKEIAELVDNHPASDLLFDKDNTYQKEFRWECPISGLKRYCRTDLNNPVKKYIIDIKTYSDDSFERGAVKHDHFLQAIDQIKGAVASGEMEAVENYYWFAISKRAPFHVDFYEYPIEEDLRLEEIYNSVLYRLRDDLKGDPYSIVYHRTEIEKIKIPNFYK